MATIINADTSNGLKLTSDTSGDLELQSAGTTKAKITSSGLTDTSNNAITSQSGKNLIINGDMQIAQRATSTSSITNNGYHTVDRFETFNDTMGTWTQSQSTTAPAGFATSLKMDCTTADASPGAADRLGIRQRFEGYNIADLNFGTADAQSVTLSFWVRSNKTGTYIAELYGVTDNRQISKSYTISSADTWEKKTITFAGDTGGTYNNDNSNELIISWYLGAGSNFTSGTLSTTWSAKTDADRAVGQVNLADSTSNEWYITGVQLETGTTATPFEHLQYGQQLELCQRYYEVYADASDVGGQTIFGIGHGFKVDQINWYFAYKTKKRIASPTLEVASGSYYEMRNFSSTKNGGLGQTGSESGTQSMLGYMSTSGITEQSCWTFYLTNSAAKIAVSSEL